MQSAVNLAILLLTASAVKESDQRPPSCDSTLRQFILENIFKDYNNETPPPPGDSPVVVTGIMGVKNVQWVNEVTHQWRSDVFLHQKWNDPRLKFNEYLGECIDAIPYITLYTPKGLNKVWKPSFLFFNKIDDFPSQSQVKIFPNGDVDLGVMAGQTQLCLGTAGWSSPSIGTGWSPSSGKGWPSTVSGTGWPAPSSVSGWNLTTDYVCDMVITGQGMTSNEVLFKWQDKHPIGLVPTPFILNDYVISDIIPRTEVTSTPVGNFSKMIAEFHFQKKEGPNLITGLRKA